MMALSRGHARSVLALWLCSISMALAVNLVYDEVLWTKKIWSSAKVSNLLLYTNPTDQDPKLPEVYPSVRGAAANSLDGPNKRRDASARPAETDGLSDGLEGLGGLATISEASDIKPAAQAAQCTVCHVLMAQAWQNLTNQAVDELLISPVAGRTAVPSQQAVKEQLLETCRKEAGDAMLPKQAILRLEESRANLMFFVIRERQKGGKPSVVEHRAVRLACKNLMTESGDDMATSLREMLGMFLSHLESALKLEGLLPDTAAAAAGAADPDAGSSSPASKPNQSLVVASLVKQVLRKVWPEPGAVTGAKPETKAAVSDDDDDDEYEDEDEDDVDPECMDLHPLCLAWADKGECEANPNYMVGGPNHKGHCKKSCGVCTPRRKGERGMPGLPDSSELRAQHPELVDKLERLLKPLQLALCNSACGASRACLNGVTGISVGQGFMPTTTVQLSSAAWQLEKPHYGPAAVEALPGAAVKALESAAAGHAPVEPGSLAAEVDAALGPELKGKVLSVPGDFFIYEYLYKNHTRHYHVDGDGTFTEDYYLGSFRRESVDMISAATGAHSALEERDLLPNMHGAMSRQEWPYVKQVYSGGDECVLGGGRRAVRKTEARIACSPDHKLHMLVREPDFCQYVFVVYSPALCKVERFKPQRRPALKQSEGDEDYYLDEE